jgi:MFS family permease
MNTTTAPRLPVALIVWAALSVALNIGIARFTYGVMLPSLRRDLGLDYFLGGALNAVHLLGYLIGTLVAPKIARRIGMVRCSAVSHGLVAAGAIVCALTPESPTAGPLVLGIGRLMTGLGAGGGIMAAIVLSFAAVAADRRPLVGGVVWAGMGVATIISGLAAPMLLASAAGWRTAFAIAAVLALLIAIFFPPRGAATEAPPPEASSATSFGPTDLLTPRWLFLLVSYFMFAFAYIAWSTFAGTRLASTNAPMLVVQLTWIVFGTTTIIGALLTIPMLHAATLRHHALSLSFILAAPGALLSAFELGVVGALIGALLVGLGAGGTPTIVSSYARDRCSAEDYARVFSFAAAALGVGQLIGPLVAGRFADMFGTIAVPVLAASAYAVGALMAMIDGRVAARK